MVTDFAGLLSQTVFELTTKILTMKFDCRSKIVALDILSMTTRHHKVRILFNFFLCHIKGVLVIIYMSHFAYACKTQGKNGISRLISALCVNCLISIPEYSRIIDYSIIWMCIWCGLLQKLYKIKKI